MELLEKLYKIYSPSKGEEPMRKFIKNYAKSLGCKVERKNGNLYITKGNAEAYPCVAAHTDQVQRLHSKDFEVYRMGDTLCGYSQENRRFEGLGADDKNGIWVGLKCLEKYDAMKCAFFWGEEIGCMGSSEADMSFFDDCRYVLQVDRRNGSDFITDISGDLCSEEFINDVPLAEFGYKPSYGMMTDVETLKSNGLKVSCCNMSCGYYNPHTDNEVTVIPELLNCLNFVYAIIERCTKVYPHEYTPTYGGYCNWGSHGSGMFRMGEDEHEIEIEDCMSEISAKLYFNPKATAEEIYSELHLMYPSVTFDEMKDLWDICREDRQS